MTQSRDTKVQFKITERTKRLLDEEIEKIKKDPSHTGKPDIGDCFNTAIIEWLHRRNIKHEDYE